jgi:FkbM family methyltransferase
MSITSYAQNFEDVILWRALGSIKDGFYIDVGAQHPVIDSVSRTFYEHGWRGIHIEPTATYADLLRHDRPDEIVLQAALSNGRGVLSLHEIPETGLSTADDTIAERHRTHGVTMHTVTVPCLTLSDVFEQVGERDIHWLKIDVEGFERQVVEGWAEHPARPWIIVLESTLPLTVQESHRNWEDLLIGYGYEPIYFDGLNRYYLSAAHSELRAAFQTPPNLFDEFELNGTANAPFTRLIERRHHSELQQLRDAHEEAKHAAYLEYTQAKQAAESRDAYRAQQELTLNQNLLSARTTIDAMKTEYDRARIVAQEEFERAVQTLHERQQSMLQREKTLSDQLNDAQQALHTVELHQVQREHEFAEREHVLVTEQTHAIDHLTAQLHIARQELLTLSQDCVARERTLNQHIHRLGDEKSTLMHSAVQRERDFARNHAEALQVVDSANREQVRLHAEQLLAQRDDAAHREQLLQDELRGLHERLGEAFSVLAEREAAHVAQIQGQLVRTQEFADRERQLQTAVHDQRMARESSERQLTEAYQRITLEQAAQDALRADLRAQVTHAAAIAEQITKMRQTLTWRLTAPLRRLHPAPAQPIHHTALAPIDEADVSAIAPLAADTSSTSPLCLGDTSLEHTMTTIGHVDDLLDLHDAAFVEATYRTLLAREPDLEGIRYYLRRLRAGHSKSKVLAQIAESSEAKLRNVDLTGLSDLLKRQRRAGHWFWGYFSRGHHIEQQLNRLENELGRVSRVPVYIQQRLDAIDHQLEIIAQRSEVLERRSEALERRSEVKEEVKVDIPKHEPTAPDLSGLSLAAKRIYSDLSRATANVQKKGVL